MLLDKVDFKRSELAAAGGDECRSDTRKVDEDCLSGSGEVNDLCVMAKGLDELPGLLARVLRRVDHNERIELGDEFTDSAGLLNEAQGHRRKQIEDDAALFQ